MSEELELRPDQWDALKSAARARGKPSRLNRYSVDSLVTHGFVALRGDLFALTPAGRKMLVRGSSQLLLDIAA